MYTVNDELLQTLSEMVPAENILLNEKMAGHTTFRVGGPAKCFVRIENQKQLSDVVCFLRKVGREFFLLGNGSNLLVSDKGYDGIILKLSGDFERIEVNGDRIVCGAAALLAQVARQAAAASLTGMEFASGIPGSLGGAMVMNAGAYGGEMSMITESVTVLSPEGEIMTLDNDTMEFAYRSSVIRGSGFIVMGAELKLQPGDINEINAVMADLRQRRISKQPLEYPSAGSTFKRPEGYFAGKLIMDAGLRGYSIGGAAVSEKHCGFVINKGNAAASDIYDVICTVQDTVKERFNVNLEREVILLGDF